MRNYLNKISLAAFAILATASFESCKQRDDWPKFDKKPVVIKDESVAVDTDKSWYVTTLEQKNNTVLKRFLADTVYNLADGITYGKIQFYDNLDQIQLVHVVEGDLNNPNVGVVSLVPYGVQLPNLQTVSGMATDNEGIGGKIMAAINGDNMSSNTTNTYGYPANGFVNYGKVMRSWVYNTTNIARPFIGVKKGSGEVFIGNTSNNTTFPYTWIDQSELLHQVSGPTWAIYNTWSNTSSTDLIARALIGMNESENKVYFICIEGKRTGIATGMGLPNFSKILKDWGINKAFMPYYSQYGQLAKREENERGKVSFPLVNVPTTSAAAVSTGTLANAVAIVSKK